MSTILFVYFDLDDTLLDHKGAERRALGDLFRQFRTEFESVQLEDVQARYHEVNADVWRRYGASEIDKERAKLERFELLIEALRLDTRTRAVELSDFYLKKYSDYWAFIPGARDALHSIAAVLPVGIVTNGFAEIQHAKLRQFPEIKDLAQSIVISEEVGFMKPDPRIFEFATRLTGFDPDRILYVGDSYRSDVVGGLGAEWQVAWYSSGAKDVPGVFRFSEWDSLLKKLQIPTG